MEKEVYRQKATTVAREFNAVAKRFGIDSEHVYASLKELCTQKAQVIKALVEIEHKGVDEHHDLAYRLVGELERLIRKQSRYLGLVKSKYERFKDDARYLKEYIAYEHKTAFLAMDYFSVLETTFSELDSAMRHEIGTIEKERKDIHRTRGSVFTRHFVRDFVDRFQSYLDDAKREADVHNASKNIRRYRDNLMRMGAKIKMEYSAPIQISSLMLIVDSITSGVVLPVISNGSGMLDNFASRPS